MKVSVLNRLRLLKLFANLLFLYGIEQLFMDTIIGDPSTRAMAVTGFTLGMVILNLPAGYIADKFGRKLAIVISSVLQILTIILQVNSQSAFSYACSMFLYAAYFTLQSNALSAYYYDYLKSQGNTKYFAKNYGSIFGFVFIAAMIANYFSGTIASASSLTFTYYLSLVPVVIGLVIACSLPNIKAQSSDNEALLSHKAQLIRNLLRPPVLLFGLRRILTTVSFLTICEFGQSYLLSFMITPQQMGQLWALCAAVCAVAMFTAKVTSKFHELSALAFTILLVFFANFAAALPWGMVLFFLIYAMNEATAVACETQVQHATDSRVRATVTSVISSLGYLLAIPFVWLFNQGIATIGMQHTHMATAGLSALGFMATIVAALLYHHHTRARAA